MDMSLFVKWLGLKARNADGQKNCMRVCLKREKRERKEEGEESGRWRLFMSEGVRTLAGVIAEFSSVPEKKVRSI